MTSARYPVTAVATTSVMLVMAELNPNCFTRYEPTKYLEINPVDSGTISPEPTPRKALTAVATSVPTAGRALRLEQRWQVRLGADG